MNSRDTMIHGIRTTSVAATLCALCLCGSSVYGKAAEWPLLYNDGVTSYQSNDFRRAAASFENATASQDRALQQRALYNLGNTAYRLGQTQPSQAQQLWERAIKSYESAMALAPNDADAKFNCDFVKKKLEELKKQQQQQQQNQKNQQDKKQEQKKDDQQQKQDQQKQDQQKQDQQQQKPEDKQSEQQKQQQSQEQQKQEQQKKDEQKKQQAQQQKQSQAEQKPEDKGGKPDNSEKMQATALLNDLQENEQNWNFFPEVQMKDLKDSGKPVKDW